MITERNTFVGGKMNKDADDRLLPKGQYRTATNIRVANSEGSDAGAIEKVLSNDKLTTLAFGADPITLGSISDTSDNKIYWAVKGANGNYLIEYDFENNITSYVLQDERVTPEFDLSENHRLQMVLIVDSDNGNRYLGWTDNYTQPKLINIERAKTYGLNGFTEEQLLLVKKPPIYAPTLSLSNTGNKENHIEERFITISYRYKYLDDMYSALSPQSEHAFDGKPFTYRFSTSTNESMLNLHNSIEISFNTGSELVTDVELVYKESGSNNIYIIESFNKDEKGWADNTTQTFDFTNNKKYKLLPPDELFRLYDNVPLLAKSIAVINNRIVFGNYTENYNLLLSNSNPISSIYTLEKEQTAIVEGTATRSLKTNRDYEIARVYLDEYGRMTTPLTSETNTIRFENDECVTKNQIKVVIPGKAPSFAKFYRFFIKESKQEYETIIPTLFFFETNYIYFYIQAADVNKVKENDFLIVKADTQEIKSEIIKLKVLEVERKEENFISGDNPENGGEPSGFYIKTSIQNLDVNFDLNSYNFYEFKHYDQSENADIISNEGLDYVSQVFKGDTLDDLSATSIYSGSADLRYEIEILNTAVSAEGVVELTGGASGSVDDITVNGVSIMSGAESFDTDLDTTASNVAANITAHTSTPNYTASAVGNVITITAVDAGSTPNGFAVVSTTTTITTTDTNMANGANDNFRFRTQQNDGTFSSWDDNTGAGYEITGVSQAVDADVSVTFDNTTGHSVNDKWLVKVNIGFSADEDNHAYACFGYPDNITIGSIITLKYFSKRERDDNSNADQFLMELISNGNYQNLEEWFYGDEIYNNILLEPNFDQTLDFFRFRKADTVETNFFGRTSHTISISETGNNHILLIKSLDSSRGSGRDVYSDVYIEVRSLEQLPIFEKEIESADLDLDLFFEIGRTYVVDNDGNHLGFDGSDISQTDVLNAQLILPVFNCISWGNAVESYKIRDEFNARTMKMDSRSSTPIENYRENKRIASYTWGGIFEQTTNYNALNEFNLSLQNFRDLDDANGSIQRMVSWNTDLDIYQEDKVIQVFYDNAVLYDQSNNENLIKSEDILKNIRPYAGEFGISTHPESLAVYGNYTYWADERRGVILRKGRSGIEIISNFGMRDWFRDIFKSDTLGLILGGYDNHTGQYVISLDGYTLSFDEKVRGWTSFYSYEPDWLVKLNNVFFSIKDGELWQHHALQTTCNFYGVPGEASVVTIFNENHQFDKIYKAVILESDNSWVTEYRTNLAFGEVSKTDFNQKESRWFAYLRQNESASDLNGRSFGMGNITAIDTLQITFANINESTSIGDELYQVNGGLQEELGTITAIDRETGIITVDALANTPVIGNFCYSLKNARIEGSEIRGYFLEATLTDSSSTQNELFAVSMNLVKSYV